MTLSRLVKYFDYYVSSIQLFFVESRQANRRRRDIIPHAVEKILGKDRFQIEALTLIQNITENRLRHARGPVQMWEHGESQLKNNRCSNSTPVHVEDDFN